MHEVIRLQEKREEFRRRKEVPPPDMFRLGCLMMLASCHMTALYVRALMGEPAGG